jgi:hypothetical protein
MGSIGARVVVEDGGEGLLSLLGVLLRAADRFGLEVRERRLKGRSQFGVLASAMVMMGLLELEW